jgi:hypothetical protein
MSSGRYGYIPRTESAYTVLGLENKTCYTDADISRLYSLGVDLPHDDRHPFKDSIVTLLSKSVSSQELLISKTEEFLPLARKRVKNLADNQQRSLTEFFVRGHSF